MSIFGHHLTIQEFTRGVVALMYVTCGREKKSCVVDKHGEILVLICEYQKMKLSLLVTSHSYRIGDRAPDKTQHIKVQLEHPSDVYALLRIGTHNYFAQIYCLDSPTHYFVGIWQ